MLSLCLYPCARASGGLILIARPASKCLLLFRRATLYLPAGYRGDGARVFLPSGPQSRPLTVRVLRRMFGFVARRAGSATENVCHLFAEMDPEQPAAAIVNFINKVMLGPQLRRWGTAVDQRGGGQMSPDRTVTVWISQRLTLWPFAKIRFFNKTLFFGGGCFFNLILAFLCFFCLL